MYDECPRWLIVRGRHTEAKKALRRAARLNNATLPADDELDYLMTKIQKVSRSGQRSGRWSGQRSCCRVAEISTINTWPDSV